MASTTYEVAGKSVGRVGYGAMQLPGAGVTGPPRDHDEATAVLRTLQVEQLGAVNLRRMLEHGIAARRSRRWKTSWRR